MAVIKQGEAAAYRKPQLIRLMCLECEHRFIKAVTHWRQIHLREQRKAEVAAIRCPACGSNRLDPDRHRA
jgi:DNA-directed RNA polymerase subunit RPC12/RpoP